MHSKMNSTISEIRFLYRPFLYSTANKTSEALK